MELRNARCAQAVSDKLAAVVQALFKSAAALPFGNAFSSANRAGDHVLAWGRDWRAAPPPRTISGKALPEALIAQAADGIEALGTTPERGYLKSE